MNAASRGPSWRSWIRTSSAVCALAAAACGSDSLPSRPEYGYVRVTVNSTGGDFDADGYTLVIDTEQPRTVAATSASVSESFYVAAGAHGVAIGNLAANCTVTGTTSRSASVPAGGVAEVAFEVVCVPTGVAITIRTTGSDRPEAYRLTVDDGPAKITTSNSSLAVGFLTPGSHTVTLFAPAHCPVAGGTRVTVSVASKAMTAVSFDVSCGLAVRSPKIAYANDTTIDGRFEPWTGVVNVDGTGAAMLRPADAPSWSPDGTRLLYTSTRCVDYRDDPNFVCAGRLQSIDPETGNVAAITGAVYGSRAVWNGVSEAVAFDVASQTSNFRELSVLQLTSGVVTKLAIAGPISEQRPSWSPDGTRIAFACTWAPISMDVCVVNADGTGLVRLTNDEQLDDYPAWSPDGTTIAFTRHPFGRADPASAEIVLLKLATSQITTLTSGTDAAWSPDGSKLVFVGGDGLFVIDANGANRRRLTTGLHRSPAWRP